MKLSVVIPVFNEERTIEKILKKVDAAPLPKGVTKEIVIVDDCSTDNTRSYLEKIRNKRYKILYHEKNQGKGAALRTGYANCTGDIIIVQDADMEYNPREYSSLIEPIINGEADVVYGSRFMGGKPHKVVHFWHMLGNRLLTVISNMLTDLHLTDMETCYKVFKREVIQNIRLQENRFGIEPEVTAKISELVRKDKIKIYEVGISYNNRSYEEGKKIGMKDAFRAVWCMLKYNTTLLAKVIKYVISGIFVALSQFVSMILLVEYFGFNSILLQNIAYAISIEVSIIVGFFLHSIITWGYKFHSTGNFVSKLMSFNLITGISFTVRQGLFYFLLLMGVEYKLNTLIGIFAAIVMNFIGYDKIIFKKQEKLLSGDEAN